MESTAEEVVVWSTARLPFEATGDLLRLRTTLRAALRNMAAQPGAGLLATYAAPDKAFVDVENVLLYNVGAASYGHLLSAGLVCRRVPGADNRHHMRYETVSPLPEPDPGAIQVLAEVDAPLSRLPATAGEWWAALRPYADLAARTAADPTSFVLDVRLECPATERRRLAGMIKSMLDGLVSVFHAHDGSNEIGLYGRVDGLGEHAVAWSLLCDPSANVLGTRTLVRPYRAGIMWNPVDDRCSAFRVGIIPGPGRRLSARLLS